MVSPNSRVTFYLNGKEEELLEAFIGSEKKTVQVFFKRKGRPATLGFLFPTAKKHFDDGDWVIVSQQKLVA